MQGKKTLLVHAVELCSKRATTSGLNPLKTLAITVIGQKEEVPSVSDRLFRAHPGVLKATRQMRGSRAILRKLMRVAKTGETTGEATKRPRKVLTPSMIPKFVTAATEDDAAAIDGVEACTAIERSLG